LSKKNQGSNRGSILRGRRRRNKCQEEEEEKSRREAVIQVVTQRQVE
jgi:hypothetical protein